MRARNAKISVSGERTDAGRSIESRGNVSWREIKVSTTISNVPVEEGMVHHVVRSVAGRRTVE